MDMRSTVDVDMPMLKLTDTGAIHEAELPTFPSAIAYVVSTSAMLAL